MAQTKWQIIVACFVAAFPAIWAASSFADETTTWAGPKQTIALGSQKYFVAVSEDKKFALVGPSTRFTEMTINTVKRVARAATGCTTAIEPVISMCTGGSNDEAIPMSNLKDVPAARVNLKC
ncbi:MAG: hypothetical protein QNK92_12600 [Amylibacter sp.]